ncbi:two-component system response regulator CreB [Corticibacter populi]|uniref:Two-component system response regulator CreB n=1 Tax=Corticibacter populi TaxID=1550736 RepID=A0A3M6QN84_9BURK|nr:two-component system response regulator CreB [Corticibacter populi]RMX04201.1 two-component system response regulator CreB [Corticibacter populi]RZS33228.1 winged helix family two component transcriptional regulator [Corticibacter populi]
MTDRILIVDDEPAIADTLAFALQLEGFATVHASLGGEALHLLGLTPPSEPDANASAFTATPSASAEPFALVILDVGLPDLNGFEVCRSLRQHSGIPVLFLTARSDEVDRIVGLEIGADDYVSKPFSPREVASRVRAILRRSRGLLATSGPAAAAAPAALASMAAAPAPRRFRHDAEGLRIAFQGQWLSLTRYEYLLLATLLGRPGRVFSRAQLMELVWTDAEDSLERTVDAHIKTLRAKLRAIDEACEPIETHRGLGYSIRATADADPSMSR